MFVRKVRSVFDKLLAKGTKSDISAEKNLKNIKTEKKIIDKGVRRLMYINKDSQKEH